MTSPFATATAPGETGVKIQQFEGCLIVWRPRIVMNNFPTVHGLKDVTVCAVHVIAGVGQIQASPEQPIYEPEVFVFQGHLQGQLRGLLDPSGGTMAVHRLVRGVPAKQGQQPPYLLDHNVSPQDNDLAARWYAIHGQNLPALPDLPTPPAPPQAPPQQPYQQAAQPFQPQQPAYQQQPQYAPAAPQQQPYQPQQPAPQYAQQQPAAPQYQPAPPPGGYAQPPGQTAPAYPQQAPAPAPTPGPAPTGPGVGAPPY